MTTLAATLVLVLALIMVVKEGDAVAMTARRAVKMAKEFIE